MLESAAARRKVAIKCEDYSANDEVANEVANEGISSPFAFSQQYLMPF